MGNKPTFGHLTKTDEDKISKIPVVEGKVIYSENSAMQFVDYASGRHTYGSVLSGIYDGTKYIDFSSTAINDCLTSIKTYGLVPNGQLVKIGNAVYQYRKIGNNNFIVKMDESNITINASEVGYIIYIPEFATGNNVNMNILISITNATYPNKLFMVKIKNNALDTASCEDLDGTFDASTFDVKFKNVGNGLFAISTTIDTSTIDIVSYSLSSSGSSVSEGLYVVASDLTVE